MSTVSQIKNTFTKTKNKRTESALGFFRCVTLLNWLHLKRFKCKSVNLIFFWGGLQFQLFVMQINGECNEASNLTRIRLYTKTLLQFIFFCSTKREPPVSVRCPSTSKDVLQKINHFCKMFLQKINHFCKRFVAKDFLKSINHFCKKTTMGYCVSSPAFALSGLSP